MCETRKPNSATLLGGVGTIVLAVLAATTAQAAVVTQYDFDGNLLDTAVAGVFVDDLTAYDPSQTVVPATFQPGIVGQAVELGLADGLANVLSADDSDDLDLAGDYTLEMFVHPQPEHGNHWHRLVEKWYGAQQWHFAMNYPVDGLDLFMNGANVFDGQTTAPVPANVWSHVAFTGDSAANETKVWVNGINVGTSPFVAVNPGDGPMEFGNVNIPGQEGLQYSGLIDEFEIHDAAVDEAYMLSRAAMLPDVLTWDGTNNSWGDAAHWDGPAAPTILNPAVIPGGTVTVAAPAEAHDLTVSAGGVVIDPGQSLTLYQTADFQPGTTLDLGAGATLTAGGGGSIARLNTAGDSVIGSGGLLGVGSFHDGGTTGTLSKRGTGILALNNTPDGNVVAADTTLKVEQGTLSLTGTDPFGGSRQVELAGGVLDVSSPAGEPSSTAGLIGHWGFEDPGDLGFDSANPARTRVEVGAPAYSVAGRKGGALQLDGSSYLELGTDAMTTTYSASAWLNVDEGVPDAWNVAFGHWDPGNMYMHVGFEPGGTFGDHGGGQTSGLPPSGAVRRGTWYHVATVRDGIENQLWINGVKAAQTSSGTPESIGGAFFIGTKNFAGEFKLKGLIDELLVFDRALAPDEIASLYGSAMQTGEVDLLVTADSRLNVSDSRPASFGTLTMKHGAISTSGETGEISFAATVVHPEAQWVGFDPLVPTKWNGLSTDMDGIDAAGVANLTVAKAGTGTWTVAAAPQNLHATATLEVAGGLLELRGTDPFGGRNIRVADGTLDLISGDAVGDSRIELGGGVLQLTSVGAPVPPPGGLLAYWEFEDPADIGRDSANPARTYTAMGSVGHTTEGFVGGALTLGGAGHLVVDVPDATSTYTIATWVKMDPAAVDGLWHNVVGNWSDSTWMHLSYDISVPGTFGDHSGGPTRGAPSDGPIQGDRWYHLVSVRSEDGSENQLWIDGVKVGEVSYGEAPAPSGTMYIGTTRPDGSLPWIGLIDDMAFYNRALSEEEVTGWYNAFFGGFAMGNDLLVTGDSTIRVEAGNASLGALTMQAGALSTAGSAVEVTFTGTTIAAGAQWVGFDPQVTTKWNGVTQDMDGIDAAGVENVTIAKAGPGTWTVSNPPQNLAATASFEVAGGVLELRGTDTFGGRDVKVSQGTLDVIGAAALGNSPVELAGGRLAVGAPVGAPVPPVGGLVANWQFEDPADLGLDSVNPARTSTEIGVTGHSTAGRVGGALQLTGGGYLDVGSDNFMPTYAVAAWLNVGSGAAGWRTAMGDWPSGWMHFGLDDIGSFGDHSGGRTSGLPAGGVVERDTWYHVVSVRDGMENQLWINGVKAAQTSSGTPGAPAATVAIGSTGADARNQWIGMIDELYVYDRGLSPEEVGNWYRGYLGAVDLSATDVTVTADSQIDVDALSAGFGELTMAQSAVLTTSGALEGIGFVRTTVAAGVATVGFDTQADTLPGAITAEGVTIVKLGPADLVLDSHESSLTDVTFDVPAGRLVGYHGSNPFDTAALNLSGGELLLSAKAGAASPVTYANPVTVPTDGTITAGKGGQGAEPPMIVQLGDPAGDAVTLNDGAAVTLRSTDGYELSLLGPVSGAGGLSVTEGTVTLGQGGSVTTMDVTGGSLTLGADLNVATGNLREGVVNTGAARVVVSQSMKLGLAATLGIDAPNTFGLSGADLLSAADVGLSGGTFTITGPPGGISAPADGMVAQWRFEDPFELGYDSVNTDRTSTEVGTPAHEPAGRFGGALVLDGNSHMELSNEGFLETYSISGWLNVAEGVPDGWRTAAGNWETVWMHYGFQPAGSFGDHGGGETSDFPAGGVVERDTWYHVVSIRDGMENQLWIDGVKAAQTSAGVPGAILGPFYIGTKDFSGANHWMGMIDELYVYDRALTPEEVAELADPSEAPGAIDLPGANLTVTASTDVVLDTTLPATLGNLALDAGVELSFSGAEVTVGDVTAGHDATITASVAVGGTLAPGNSPGRLNVSGGLEMGEQSVYRCEIGQWDSTGVADPWNPIPPTGPVNDKIQMIAGDALLGGTLELAATSRLHPRVQAPGQPPGVMLEWYGDQTRVIAAAGGEDSVLFQFDAVPDAQPEVYDLPGTGNWGQGHLGHGVFLTRDSGDDPVIHPGITYGTNATELHLFQAADGDTNGDRRLGSLDIQAILSANTFPDVQPADWPQGDFTGDGWCNGLDIQAILATGLYPFLPDPYAAVEPFLPGDDVADLLYYPKDQVLEDGTVIPAGTLMIDPDGLTINGFVLRSEAGAFTGAPAQQLNWFFVEDTDRQISGNMGVTFSAIHDLGAVVGPEWDAQFGDSLWPMQDLTFTYTIDGTPGTFVGTGIIMVPEPGTVVLLLSGLAGALLLWRRKKGT